MRFMMLMYPGTKGETGAMPDEKAIAAMMKYNEELANAGILLGADGLQPSAKGARIRSNGGKRSVSDGPFTETKEVLGGYWMLQVKTKEEAVEWAKRCPLGDDEMLELRQVFEMGDFGPEIAKQEGALVEKIGKRLEENNKKSASS
jgi:hypothetical protein